MIQVENENILRDVLSDFLGQAASQRHSLRRLGFQKTEECLLATSLGRLFTDEPIALIWTNAESRATGSIYIPDLDDTRRLLPEEIGGYLESGLDKGYEARPLTVNWRDEIPYVLSLSYSVKATRASCSSAGNHEKLWIVLSALDLENRKVFSWLCHYMTGLTNLFTAFQALKRYSILVRESRSLHSIEHKLDSLVTGSSIDSTSGRLHGAAEALKSLRERINAPELQSKKLEVVEGFALWTMQEILGEGWDLQAPADGTNRSSERHALDDLVAEFTRHRIYNPQRRSGSPFSDSVGNLESLIQILKAGSALDVDAGTDHGISGALIHEHFEQLGQGEEIIKLLVFWSRVHQLCRGLANSLNPEESGNRLFHRNDWRSVVDKSLPSLSRILYKLYKVRDTHTLSWLRLWFCYRITEHIHDTFDQWENRQVLGSEKWRFRADLAYVIRETIRALIFSDRKDYRFQPTNYSNALTSLIEGHVHWIVGLPQEYDVRTLLNEVREPRRVDDYSFAAGHLQHAFEIYIGGHFLCELELSDKQCQQKKSPPTVKHVLAGSAHIDWSSEEPSQEPGPHKIREFLQAFSLAALFHDAGMLLFPRDLAPGDLFLREDSTLKSEIQRVRDQLRTAAGELLKVCHSELAEAEYFDPTEEPAMSSWIDHCIERGEADHAVLGAWYIHRVFHSLEEASSEVLPQAVRAILLHSITNQKIYVERDPVAALLILCDEVFEWNPYQEGGARGVTSSHSLQSIAVDVRPRSPRAHKLRLRGLEVKNPERKLKCSLSLPFDKGASRSEGNPTEVEETGVPWPYFEIELQEPRQLQEAPHFIWMTMAQNLGRVHRDTDSERTHLWSPMVLVRSRIPEHLRSVNCYTHDLLSRLIENNRLPIRTRLKNWLTRSHVETVRVERGLNDEKAREAAQRKDLGMTRKNYFEWDLEAGEESVVICSGTQPLHTEPVYRSFPALKVDIERIMREIKGRSPVLLDRNRS